MVAVEFFVIALLAAVSSASIIQKRQLPKVISSCTTPNTVALTFDDGPYLYNKKIVDTLDAAGAIGTFFFNGDNYRCIYNEESVASVLYTYQHGHQIESHTWRHLNLTELSYDQIHNQMWLVEQALQKIVGIKPAFMRPPYGSYNELVQQVAAERKQTLVMWDFDSGDSTGSTPAESEAAYDAIIKKHPSTILPLNHETYKTTADDVLPYAIQKLQAAGYRLVSLSECTGGLPPYQSVQAPGVRDPSWQC